MTAIEVLTDRKGQRLTVVGDEYEVLVRVNLDTYRSALANMVVNFNHSDNQILRISGADVSLLDVGEEIVLSNSATGGNDGTYVIQAIDSVGGLMTVSAGLAASDNNDTITVTPSYEVIRASQVGLKYISSVEVLAQESISNRFHCQLDAVTGKMMLRDIGDSPCFSLVATDVASNVNEAAGDLGMVLLRVRGSL
tara:strand:+ start:8474 stop:9058 length:585 start_codon:yes stop_codon:yes gene_type:complete